jgi:hypothetical protein
MPSRRVLLHGTPLTPQVWEQVAALLPGPVACPPVTPHGSARSTDALAAFPGELDLRNHDGDPPGGIKLDDPSGPGR